MTTTKTETLTEAMLTDLRREAAAAGDSIQVKLCDSAIGGDEDAASACAEAINSARRSAAEGATPVLVVA